MSYTERKVHLSKMYQLSSKEWITYGSIGAVVVFIILEIFYHSLWLSVIAALVAGILYPLYMRNELGQRRRVRIAGEFQEILYSLSAALRAGRSLEGAFEAVYQEMTYEYYPYIYVYWKQILAKLRLHQRLDDILYEFAVDTEVDEIMSFAQIVAVSKKTEGDITKIIENTARLLQEKMEMQQEIRILLTRKQTEQKILNTMPFLIIGLLTLMSPDYVEPLYNSVQGRVIMTVCIVLAGVSIIIARKVSGISL